MFGRNRARSERIPGSIAKVASGFRKSRTGQEHGVFPWELRGQRAVIYKTHAANGRAAIQGHRKELYTMLSWALTFLIIALIAAVLGFTGLAGTAAYIAKILFFVFLVLFIVSLITGRRGPVA